MALPEGNERDLLLGRWVVCAVDQRPFSLGPDSFCVVCPLVLVGGEPIGERAVELFPNRGRLWWKLHHRLNPSSVLPGALFTVCVEEAIDFDPSNPRKDYFQVRREDVGIGAQGFLELFEVDELPEPRALRRGFSLAVDRPPAPRVILATKTELLGPLQADWQGDETVVLKAGDGEVHRASRGLLPRDQELRFEISTSRFDYRDQERRTSIQLVPEDIVPKMTTHGEPLDVAGDEDVLRWGLKVIGVSRRARQELRDNLERALTLAPVGEPNDRHAARFREICQHADAILQLGDTLAEEIAASTDRFEPLIEKHVALLAGDRVEAAVKAHEQEIETRCRQHEQRLERLRKDCEELEQQYEAQAAEQQRRFEREIETRLAELEKRELEVGQREHHVAQREQEIEARLEGLVIRLETESQKVVNDVLVTLPVLTRLGLGTRQERPAPSHSLELPDFLERPRKRGGLSERDFLDQFRAVVRHRGFVFDDDDLTNFHISVKCGFWTVLAGPSGTGKSTLPRLYAEALGVLDEYLVVAVRPDWMDDRDLLGAFNALSGRFEPSACGLVDQLIQASEDARQKRGGIFLLCLDEMNLARVEHYFSQFLSVMEQPPERRRIDLFARGLARADDPYGRYRSLGIPENVRFIGTVNIDETTHFFSPKVIDRASMVLLEEAGDGSELPVAGAMTISAGGLAPVHVEEYREWIQPPQAADEETREFLQSLLEVLHHHDAAIGHRTRRRLFAYLASARGLLPRDRARDFAVAQMVVPRLRATTREYPRLLESLHQRLPAERFRRSSRILAKLLESGGRYDFFQVL